MNKLTLPQFDSCIKAIKDFMELQEKLNDAIKVISPSSTGVVEFGNDFIDKYIWLLENQMDDHCQFISWYVFINEFGNKAYAAGHGKGIDKLIITAKDLYDLILLID